MKINGHRPQKKAQRPNKQQGGLLQKVLAAKAWILMSLVLLLLVGSVGLTAMGFVAGVWQRPHVMFAIDELGISGGSLSNRVIVKNLITNTLKIPQRFIQAHLNAPPVPHLDIDIKFKHLDKIHQKRNEALKLGQIIQGDDDFVPASIRYNGEEVKVKMRLKGDWTDHLKGKKWSFRIHTKGKDALMGLRRFSLQAPWTRGYQGEALFLAHMRKLGIVSPRYFFVDVDINGKNIGLMAIEEHFSKELLESQQRKESVIIRLDETLQWDSVALNYRPGIYSSYTNAYIKPFGGSAIKKSPTLSTDLKSATGLLRGFINDELPASAVFDVDLMGKFLAGVELWDAHHALLWNQSRFYYNPQTGRLEPIAYDADSHVPSHAGGLIGPNKAVSLAPKILADPLMQKSYIKWIRQLSKEFTSGELIQWLRGVEAEPLRILHREFPIVPPYDFTRATGRAQMLSSLTPENYQDYIDAPPATNFNYPQLMYAFAEKTLQGSVLELMNIIDRPIVVTAVKGNKALKEKIKLPITLAPTLYEKQPTPVRIALGHIDNKTLAGLTVTAHIQGDENQRKTVSVLSYHSGRQQPILPISTVKSIQQQFSFLRWDAGQQQFTIPSGSWQIPSSMVLPPHTSLTVEKGTTLKFGSQANLIVRGAVHFDGTADAPIHLQGLSENATWQGVAVLQASKPSTWQHVIVKNTAGHQQKDWAITGSVTFYQSDVTLKNSTFSNNTAEDALNIVRSQFTLNNVTIKNTTSDAFDCDFCEGKVIGGLYQNIGGDGVDVSGTTIEINKTHFKGITDKAISIGEASTATAKQVNITNAGTGVASKDRSTVNISNSTLNNIQHVGMMAYVKKPEYGAAKITANQIQWGSMPKKVLAQTGSALTLDGKAVPPEDVNVDQLYKEGHMKK